MFKLLGGGKGWRKKDCEDAALVDNVTRLMMMPVLIGSTQTVKQNYIFFTEEISLQNFPADMGF